MKKKRMVTGIILLMSLALTLIIVMQTVHLINSYNRTKEMLDRGISEAISRTLVSLQKHDAVVFVYDKLNQSNRETDSIFPIDPYMSQLGLNPTFTQISGGMEIKISYPGTGMENFTYSFYSGSNDFSTIESFMLNQFSEQQMEFDQIVMQLETEYMQRQIPIEQRFNAPTIENILEKSLSSMGLNLDFEFAITDDKDNVKIKSDDFCINRSKECYKFNMAPGSLFSNPDVLLVDFPNKKQYALKSIYAQLATSIFLVLIFILVFGASLYALIRQKKLTEIKNDFINNMTHEFKTPIATIKLAAASIKNEKTRSNALATDHMLDIITQETTKMNHHIEQVLQMAVLDKQNLEVNKTKEDINEIVSDTVENIELVIEEKGGNITLNICNDNIIIPVDRDLITNVISNLLDNAIKYSKEIPEIVVTTYVKSDKYHIDIKDNGIGMSKEVQSKVFDRFYRAPTGNVHNIKGFGLGLNYAREIVDAHKGSISVKSTQGKGSTFTVSLPLK
ncbi:MAG: HAMP domain-containing histidine kinase [Bacteroidales bacterium]|nr:HAMP domain-containing histidine kinase [Bacteroidales bacterium]